MLGLMNSCLTCPAVTVKLEETLGLEHRGESTVTLTCVVREVVTKSSTLMLAPLFSMQPKINSVPRLSGAPKGKKIKRSCESLMYMYWGGGFGFFLFVLGWFFWIVCLLFFFFCKGSYIAYDIRFKCLKQLGCSLQTLDMSGWFQFLLT